MMNTTTTTTSITPSEELHRVRSCSTSLLLSPKQKVPFNNSFYSHIIMNTEDSLLVDDDSDSTTDRDDDDDNDENDNNNNNNIDNEVISVSSCCHDQIQKNNLLLLSSSSSSIVNVQLQSYMEQIQTIEDMNRRVHQESNVLHALDDISIAPLHLLEGLRSLKQQKEHVQQQQQQQQPIQRIRKKEHLLDDIPDSITSNSCCSSRSSSSDSVMITIPPLADDLSSCGCDVPDDDDNRITSNFLKTRRSTSLASNSNHDPNEYTGMNPSSTVIDSNEYSPNGISNDLYLDLNQRNEQLCNKLKECYHIIVSIQANADLKVRNIQTKVNQLQMELRIERNNNIYVSQQLNRMKLNHEIQNQKQQQQTRTKKKNEKESCSSTTDVTDKDWMTENVLPTKQSTEQQKVNETCRKFKKRMPNDRVVETSWERKEQPGQFLCTPSHDKTKRRKSLLELGKHNQVDNNDDDNSTEENQILNHLDDVHYTKNEQQIPTQEQHTKFDTNGWCEGKNVQPFLIHTNYKNVPVSPCSIPVTTRTTTSAPPPPHAPPTYQTLSRQILQNNSFVNKKLHIYKNG